jgi:phage baseplate assembly protein W
MFTNSFAYPNLFDPTSGRCTLKEDYSSILNRVGLLIKTYEGEEFMFPEFGSKASDALLSYNTKARVQKAKEDIIAAIIKFEPFVDASMIEISDISEGDALKLSVTLVLDKQFRELAGTIEWSFDQKGGTL